MKIVIELRSICTKKDFDRVRAHFKRGQSAFVGEAESVYPLVTTFSPPDFCRNGPSFEGQLDMVVKMELDRFLTLMGVLDG